jgi:SAM-dependent methyltransferase
MTVRELKSTWENLGRTDPLWAVLSDPDRRHGGWDLDEFMTTGHESVRYLFDVARDRDTTLTGRVLDFGCGVGRISNALAEKVDEVVGIDIADSMIEQARQLNRHPDRLRFVSYDGGALPFPDNHFDAAVSLIVLQHARPAVQLAALLELQRVVRPGGLLVLQTASHPTRAAALDEAGRRVAIEILRAPAELAAGAGASVLARLTNTSSLAWPADRLIKLGNHWSAEGGLVIQDDGRAELPHEVAAGDSVELELRVVAPSTPGRYLLELDVVQEFVSWWAESGNQPATAPVVVNAAEIDQPAAENTEPVRIADDRPAPVAVAEPAGTMEVHGLHTDLVHSLFEHCGQQVLSAVPDQLAGADWRSYTYLVRVGE